MSSSTQKRGFRLPWAAEHGSDEATGAATTDQAALDPTPAAVSDDLGDGSPSAAESTPPAMTTDAAPAASDVPDVSPEAEMIDTEDEAKDRIARALGSGAWPTEDWESPRKPAGDAGASGGPLPVHVESHARAPRRENPLVAGLVKAMREAAIASRGETTSRLQTEATARVEEIRTAATNESATLRKRVDEDIAGIRDWSKGEMARIRQETEERIEARRAEAIDESKRHVESVDHLVERVESTVAAFEADMDRFFERLLAENDPAQLAALAEQAPEPPDLSSDVPTAASEWEDVSWTAPDASAETEAEARFGATDADTAEASDTEVDAHGADDRLKAEAVADAETSDAGGDAPGAGDALEATAAAEAEAEATEGLDMAARDEWPAAVLAAARRSDTTNDGASDGPGHSRLIVSGLTSVAGISSFKGAVGQLPGVRSVSVSTGERGVFVFTVNHDPEADMAEAVTSLTSFAVQITEASADGLTVTAHEPAA